VSPSPWVDVRVTRPLETRVEGTHRLVDIPEVKEALAYLASIDLSRFPMPLQLEVWRVEVVDIVAPLLALEVWVHSIVADRVTGSPIKVKFTGAHTFLVGPGLVHTVARAVREQVREAVLHELDECFLVGGARLYDPHAGEIAP
jgi:hypothetical protein